MRSHKHWAGRAGKRNFMACDCMKEQCLLSKVAATQNATISKDSVKAYISSVNRVE